MKYTHAAPSSCLFYFKLSASEIVVTRSFPLGSLTREKKIGSQYLPHFQELIQECVQLRSATFQVYTTRELPSRNVTGGLHGL